MPFTSFLGWKNLRRKKTPSTILTPSRQKLPMLEFLPHPLDSFDGQQAICGSGGEGANCAHVAALSGRRSPILRLCRACCQVGRANHQRYRKVGRLSESVGQGAGAVSARWARRKSFLRRKKGMEPIMAVPRRPSEPAELRPRSLFAGGYRAQGQEIRVPGRPPERHGPSRGSGWHTGSPQPRCGPSHVHGPIGDPSVEQVALNADTLRAHDV